MKFKSVAARIITFVLPVVAITMIFSAVVFMTMSESIDAQFNERMQESLQSAEERINTELALNTNVARSMAFYVESSSIDDARDGNLVAFSMVIIPIVGLILIMILLILTARYLQRVAGKVNSFAVKAASGDLSERSRF